MTEDEVLSLHRGCQGAQHVWVSLQAEVAEEPSALKLVLIDSERELASLYLEALGWDSVGSARYAMNGLTFVLYDPSELIDRPLMLGVEVTLMASRHDPLGRRQLRWVDRSARLQDISDLLITHGDTLTHVERLAEAAEDEMSDVIIEYVSLSIDERFTTRLVLTV